MNIRKSVRLNQNPQYKKGYVKKHVVCVLNVNLMENAVSWVRNKNNELADYRKKIENVQLTPVEITQQSYFQLKDFTDLQFDDPKKSVSDKLKDIDNDTVLYIFCHGYIENTFDQDLALQINLKSIKIPEIEFSAKELFKFLKNHKLNPKHKFLKLAACYSEKFAQELSKVTKGYFSEMVIAGYYGEFIANQNSNYKYAGLVHESGYLIEENEKQYSIINKGKIEPFTEMVQFYRSHNWRYLFKKGKLIEGPVKKGEADLNGFVPIPVSIPKKRKNSAPAHSESLEEEKEEGKKEAVNSPQISTNKKRFFSQVKSIETSDVAKSSKPSEEATERKLQTP
jgi:hypothetical protein